MTVLSKVNTDGSPEGLCLKAGKFYDVIAYEPPCGYFDQESVLIHIGEDGKHHWYSMDKFVMVKDEQQIIGPWPPFHITFN